MLSAIDRQTTTGTSLDVRVNRDNRSLKGNRGNLNGNIIRITGSGASVRRKANRVRIQRVCTARRSANTTIIVGNTDGKGDLTGGLRFIIVYGIIGQGKCNAGLVVILAAAAMITRCLHSNHTITLIGDRNCTTTMRSAQCESSTTYIESLRIIGKCNRCQTDNHSPGNNNCYQQNK